MKVDSRLISLVSCVIIVLLWSVVSVAAGSEVILPSPLIVLGSLRDILISPKSYSNMAATFFRVIRSTLIVVLSGAVVGTIAGLNKTFLAAIKPLVAVFKATPVMSVILIAFIWLKTGSVPIFSAFLMSFPVMFIQTVQGFLNMDPKLDEMCTIYGIKGKERIKHYVLPSLSPSFVTGAKQTLSMNWKVVIAAEVITVPQSGIGRALQLAQVQLETSVVFAWTVVAVFLTAFGDAAFNRVLKLISQRRPSK